MKPLVRMCAIFAGLVVIAYIGAATFFIIKGGTPTAKSDTPAYYQFSQHGLVHGFDVHDPVSGNPAETFDVCGQAGVNATVVIPQVQSDNTTSDTQVFVWCNRGGS